MSSGKPVPKRDSTVRTAVVLALAAAATLGAHIAAADELRPFQAAYLWRWKGAALALSRLNFDRQHDDTWVYSSSTEPRGIGFLYPMRPKLESTMRITPQGVQPLSFHASGSGARHDADVTFNWDTGKATGTYEGSAIDIAITPGVQDDMSVQIAMISQLLSGETPEILREIDAHGIRDYLFKRAGQETLTTPIGRVDTIIYATQRPGSKRITRYWCAPADGYIPLQVQQTVDRNVEWTMTVESLNRE
jgi:hypothetical protein